MAPPHLIVTGRNGELDGTTPADVAGIVREAVAQGKVVIHLHGGLVSEASATQNATRLAEVYEGAGAYPIFMVWQSGLLEVVRHNLDEIFKEDLFQSLLRRVLQFTVGKVWQEEDQRAAGVLPTPSLMRVEGELAQRATGQEPFGSTTEAEVADVAEVTEAEREQLARALQSDPAVRAAVEQVVEQRHPETTSEGARGLTVRRQASAASLIDPDVLDEIDPGAAAGERGLISTLALAEKAAAVLVRVVRRFRSDEDHGVYPTVVEELLREFYLGNAGGAVWQAMKRETLDTFAEPGRGGSLLLDALADELARTGARPSITLVGHSTGAVFIDNLLAAVARGRADGSRPWPDDMLFRVILLAPAATYASFTEALGTTQNLIGELRLFTMTDEAEQADHLVGPVYPRSLLYLVSGVVERDDRGDSTVMPLIGMARYRSPAYAQRANLITGRGYLTDERVVLSPSAPDAGVGSRAGARSHTAFDEDPLVLGSIANLLGASP